MQKHGYVYMLANKENGTIYIGVTSNLVQRIWQHKEKLAEGFTKQYNLTRLVWWEEHQTIEDAIYKEKRMKNWPRYWKLQLISANNPGWTDLYDSIIGLDSGSSPE